MIQQKQLGQFYTDKNIFKNTAFIKWLNTIPLDKRECILEPFAGSNGIIKMLDNLGFIKSFKSFDIMPRDGSVNYQDTLLDFPKGFFVGVTNPPFLAKNSATRHALDINFDSHNDLYELCLFKCLENLEYVAAIIPESFITNALFDKSRLYTIISLNEKRIFKDTEHPVCLALFNPTIQNDYSIYANDNLLGTYKELKEKEDNLLISNIMHNYKICWHNPEGQLGLEVIDATEKKKKIHFMHGDIINGDEVNLKSRLRTRILILDEKNKLVKKGKIIKIIKILNAFLNNYRNETHDIFLTAFKGLRNDGYYRRRLDFTKARQIVDAGLILMEDISNGEI
jgi:hypothetical protein